MILNLNVTGPPNDQSLCTIKTEGLWRYGSLGGWGSGGEGQREGD